jgi:hypothetical protein
MSNDRASWSCEAYGPELDELRPEHAPHCFYELIDPCQVRVQCRVRMQLERGRVYERLLELAAQGEGYAWMILEDVEGPDDLLNAGGVRQHPDVATGDSPSAGPTPPD